jgi:hypothetical protein
MLKNYETLKTVGAILGREQIVIAVINYNLNKNRLEGAQIHVFSDKESGITLYSNGVVLSGKYNPVKGAGAIKFVLNPNYDLPWTSSNNYTDAVEIKSDVDFLIEKNPCIMKKHEAVKTLIANYDDFISYCLKNKYMQVRQLKHLSTQTKYNQLLNEKKEVAAAKNETVVTLDDKKVLKNREPNYMYITFKPGFYITEDCYGNEIEVNDISNVEIRKGVILKDMSLIWTEKYFARCKLPSVPLNHIIVFNNEGVFPNDGRIYIKG